MARAHASVRRHRRTLALLVPVALATVNGVLLAVDADPSAEEVVSTKVHQDTSVPLALAMPAQAAAPSTTAPPTTAPSTTAPPTTAPPTTAPVPLSTVPPSPPPPPARTLDQRCEQAIAAVGLSPAPGFGLRCGGGYNTGADGNTTYWCNDLSNGSTCTGTAYIHPDDGDSDAEWRAVVRHEIGHTHCIRYGPDFSEACADAF